MTNRQKPSKAMHITLWLAQVVLAIVLVWAGTMKLFQPIEKLSAMWPWTGQIPVLLVKLSGIVDLIGAIGLILPALVRIKPQLTPIAALGIIALMVCASIFHIARGEASSIGVNIAFALIAAFIAWGRLTKAPITSVQ
ncbi:DoxX family membrane protein [Spirosoma sp. HMF4905]|uniref:DoxX family membrane protein n=1 Tax=Spirosoma arboris TaxID=2682092 RepID=A0A7K1S5Y7_9BACT|nr:DoxX family protein [Spirosoma arboris]MVM29232.1 DoxX family membrane protein [Spirosoma arboris]